MNGFWLNIRNVLNYRFSTLATDAFPRLTPHGIISNHIIPKHIQQTVYEPVKIGLQLPHMAC